MIDFEQFTHPGSRNMNEDHCGVSFYGESVCFVVADGLGGHGGGDIASQLAVNTFCGMFASYGWSSYFFQDAFTAAQNAIILQQQRQCALSRMKTTLVALVIHNGVAHWAHIGDSRLYHFKNKKLKKRTLDHSVPQMLCLSGAIQESEIRHHPDRNRVLRVLGNYGEQPRFEVAKPVRLRGQEHFLLCTDGFWEAEEDADMECFLLASDNIHDWIAYQANYILANASNHELDNFSCIAVSYHASGLLGQ